MDRLNELTPRIKDGKCVFLIGAGFSMMAGCKSWDQLIELLQEHEVIKDKLKGDGKPTNLSHEQIISFCYRELKNTNNLQYYRSVVREVTTPDPDLFKEVYLPVAKAIKNIAPLPKIVTLNVDGCLTSTRQFPLDSVIYTTEEFTTDKLDNDRFYIFHIHGYIEEMNHAVLPISQYVQQYADQNFRNFMKYLFTNYSILFIGCSFRDRRLIDLMYESKTEGPHYALIATETGFPIQDAAVYKEELNLNIIEYGSYTVFPTEFMKWIELNFAKDYLKLGLDEQ